MTEQNEDALEQIKDRAGEKYNHSELHINRVPDHTIEKLQTLAYDKFAGDYGMALTFLIELKQLKEEFDTQLQATTSKVMELEEQVQHLKQTESQTQDDKSGRKVNTIG